MKKIKSAAQILLVLVLSLSVSVNTWALTLNITTYSPNTPANVIGSITTGPDGNLWFTKSLEGQFAKITPAGTVTEYDLPSGISPTFITTGPDGNIWMTTGSGNGKIIKASTEGSILDIYDFSSQLSGSPSGSITAYVITTGPDGNLWFNAARSSGSGGFIGKLTTSGALTTYPVNSGGMGITTGPDGNLWYAIGSSSGSANSIGKITPSGQVTEYPLPGTGDGISMVTTGPDGNIWYTRSPVTTPSIGKITPSGQVAEYPTAPNSGIYYGLVSGPDGRIWYTESFLSKIAAIDTNGVVEEYDVSSAGSPVAITTGPDGNLWFTVMIQNESKIARITNTPKKEEPTTTEDVPVAIATKTPAAPKTGVILNTIIFAVAAISIVLPVVYERNRSSKRNKTSTR